MRLGKIAAVLCLAAAAAAAQGYLIGKDDLLDISFWQESSLNLTARVDADGQITLPIGGALRAEGLTTAQLADAIVERISLYNRRITTATVKVSEFGSRKVYVMGHVRNPGKYTFEKIPNLWDIVSEAGGPLENANLSSVLIIRNSGDDEPSTTTVDVAGILRDRSFQLLPEVKAGDNIFLPAVVGNVPGSGIQAMQPQQNILFIYGEVGHPGVYTFSKELTLLEALVTAGGPSARARLAKVRVIRKSGVYSSVTHVNVQKYTEESSPAFFMVKGGDTIYVPPKHSFRESIGWDLIMIFTGAALTALAYDVISSR